MLRASVAPIMPREKSVNATRWVVAARKIAAACCYISALAATAAQADDKTYVMKFTLPTVIFHEGLPGHQLEGGLALSNPHLSLLRKTISFPAYGEG